MPIVSAFPLGLLLAGTTAVTLADGSSAPLLTATGQITIDSETRVGIILLQGGAADILLGMDFLTKFGRVMLIHPTKGIVSLMHQSEFDALFDEPVQTPFEPPVT